MPPTPKFPHNSLPGSKLPYESCAESPDWSESVLRTSLEARGLVVVVVDILEDSGVKLMVNKFKPRVIAYVSVLDCSTMV